MNCKSKGFEPFINFATMSLFKDMLRGVGANRAWHAVRYRLVKYQRERNSLRLRKEIEWFGWKWCGFFVDTALLNRDSVILSFGVGTDISFDLSLQRRGVKHIYLFDPTPVASEFINTLHLPATFSFYPFGLSDHDGKQIFYLPSKSHRVSGSSLNLDHLQSQKNIEVEMKTISTIMKELNLLQIDLLKMDIEGSEFVVINNMMAEKIYPRQLCVEFHARYFEDGKQKMKNTIALLEEHKYEVSAYTDGEEYLFCLKDK